MMQRRLIHSVAAVLILTAVWGGPGILAQRHQFRVVTVVSSGGDIVLLPEGTDFDIDLRDGRYRLHSEFLTDPLESGELRIRCSLRTQRWLGRSERDLPIYEEDVQEHDFQVSLSEGLVLWPFGGEDRAESLRIEIVPSLSRRTEILDDGSPRPLEIDLRIPAPDGQVSVSARNVPHRYRLQAEVWSGDERLASAERALLYREKTPLQLDIAGTGLITIVGAVEVFQRSRAADLVTFRFDHRWQDRVLGGNWIAVMETDAERSFPLSLPDQGGEVELRLRITQER